MDVARQQRRHRPGDLTALFELMQVADYVIPMAIRVACEFRIADLLIDGPVAAAELARARELDPRSLQRLLRTLACRGIFRETQAGVFALSPLADVLRSDHPLSLRDAYPLLPGDLRAFGRLLHSIRTGESSFEEVHDTDYWTWMAEHPEDSGRLDRAQQAQTRLELRVLTRALQWGSFGEVVDVGGGNGAFLAGILAGWPELRGRVVDLPHVVEAARERFRTGGLGDRAQVCAGSFFDPLPPGAGAYVLKRVLYGWRDEPALRILERVRDAMGPASRLLVIEPLKARGASDMGNRYDLMLLALSGTGARTRAELDRLFARADLEIDRVVATVMFPVVVVRRRATPGAAA